MDNNKKVFNFVQSLDDYKAKFDHALKGFEDVIATQPYSPLANRISSVKEFLSIAANSNHQDEVEDTFNKLLKELNKTYRVNDENYGGGYVHRCLWLLSCGHMSILNSLDEFSGKNTGYTLLDRYLFVDNDEEITFLECVERELKKESLSFDNAEDAIAPIIAEYDGHRITWDVLAAIYEKNTVCDPAPEYRGAAPDVMDRFSRGDFSDSGLGTSTSDNTNDSSMEP